MASSSFRASKWDPIYIIAQIFAVQSLFYISFSLILFIALTFSGADLTLDLLFDASQIRTDTGFGWSLIVVWLLNSLMSIVILTFIVQRAKLILDYVLTFHFWHLVGCWCLTKFPTQGTWWLLQLVTVAVMTFGGEWACMHREMKPIMISTTNRQDEASSSNNRSKRKSSDVATQKQEGALMSVVDKAKKALFSQKQSARYDQIPLNDMEEGTSHSRS
ncbi:MAG: integral membrane protein S linking to the trans Golgi network-domain-containing protein [Benjaminiella poitrasii]|nr:MAG: integral membrane protein S linking to the trans Golgi network-domain-containing protein [Benjaminiella poitrasii]